MTLALLSHASLLICEDEPKSLPYAISLSGPIGADGEQIDETDTQIADGKARMTSVMDASVSRVRPVVLAVLTTVLGVFPLLWDPFFQSLAVVIIFGLTFATILTLIVVPTLYAIFFRISQDEV
jgi:Cu/Ag efflux pump CusA